MPFPTNKQERQQAIKAALALKKLTPEQRKAVLAKELKKRSLGA